ncbi:MAG: hypothetical protein MPJ25_00440, partial [Pirellulales bacterium]|nr:hypothetical protein [Pirellulales bacterium]
LKLQQTLQRLTPAGVYLDADGLAEIDLGNGTSYNPQEALNMYFQTGSVIGRSMTVDGDPNGGKIPIQELPGGGGGQVEILINAYNHYLNMIRDVTGLNEARDGSDPDPYSLVGVQKLAAANSNTATRHILYASMYLTQSLGEAITIRLKDVLEFHPQGEALVGAIGRFSVGSLRELNRLHQHDFGIFMEVSPDEEEKQMLENNIQAALSKDQILLEDAIDIRDVKNLKLANQLMKFRRKKKMMADQQIQLEQQEAQAKAQGEAQMALKKAEGDAEMMKVEAGMKGDAHKNELEIKKMEIEAQIKKELMKYEFDLNKQLKKMELGVGKKMADDKNRSDEKKEKMKQGPPTSGKPTKGFESKGNDVLGGFDTSKFEPK